MRHTIILLVTVLYIIYKLNFISFFSKYPSQEALMMLNIEIGWRGMVWNGIGWCGMASKSEMKKL
jgi:hypothetical protein